MDRRKMILQSKANRATLREAAAKILADLDAIEALPAEQRMRPEGDAALATFLDDVARLYATVGPPRMVGPLKLAKGDRA